MNLIDKDEAIAFAREAFKGASFVDTFMVGFLAECPTIDPVHAAGACYCWECEYHATGLCPSLRQVIMNSFDFCSRGKRREIHNET